MILCMNRFNWQGLRKPRASGDDPILLKVLYSLLL